MSDPVKVSYDHNETAEDLRHHPKTWRLGLRLAILANVCVMVFLGNLNSAGLAPGFPLLVAEFGISYEEVSSSVSYAVLLLGISTFFWVPTASLCGKRPVLIISLIVFILGCVWGHQANSFQSFMGSRIFGSFGAGAVQAIGPALIAEIFMERDYTKAMGAYTASLCLGSQGGPLVGGHLMEHLGWRWFQLVCCIIAAFNLVSVIVLCPETAFDQSLLSGETAADLDAHIQRVHNANPDQQRTWKIWKTNTFYLRHPDVKSKGLMSWCTSFILQFEFLLDPVVLCCAALWGITVAWAVAISVLSPSLFALPPFYFGPAALGNWAATSIIGIAVGYMFSPLVDRLAQVTSRSKGFHRPEDRLISIIIPFLICSPGLILFGYTYIADSFYGPAVGSAMQIAGLQLVPATVLSYAVDSYPSDAAEVAALINAITHVLPFALSLKVSAWLSHDGVTKLFLHMAIIQWAIIGGLGLLLFLSGPWLRRKSMEFHGNYGIRKWLSALSR